MKKPDGTHAKNDAENAEAFCKNHFLKLHNNTAGTDCDPSALDDLTQVPTNAKLGDVPTSKDIRSALGRMQNEKAPRGDRSADTDHDSIESM